ncbi:MAG: hypothetical protein J5847_02980 [Clostridia bacterium]|nr:hypothetical protein [Clostridia bacterium]
MKEQLLTRVFALTMTLLLALSFTGCQKASDKMDEAVYGALDKVESQSSSKYGSAQEIVDDYAAQMKKKARTLGKELKNEAPARYKKDGSLAILLKEKTGVLADLYGKGSGEISTYVLYNGDGQAQPYIDALYDAYTEATDLLMDDYEEALKTVR